MEPLPFMDISMPPPSEWTGDNLGKLLTSVRPSWSYSDVTWKSLSGGYMNHTVKCWSEKQATYYADKDGGEDEDAVVKQGDTDKEGGEDAVVIRVAYMFPPGRSLPASASITRVLAARGLSAPPLLRFTNGVVYPFIEGATADQDTFTDPTMRRLVAFELAAIHSVRPNDCLPPEEWISEKPSFLSNIRRCIDDTPEEWSHVDGLTSCLVTREELMEEIRFVQEKCGVYEVESPPVLTHGDTFYSNFLYNTSEGWLKLIDFDLSCFDIASKDITQFLQTAKAEIQTMALNFRSFSHEEESEFIRIYLEECEKLAGREVAVSPETCQIFLEQCQDMKLAQLLWVSVIFIAQMLHEGNDDFMWLVNGSMKQYFKLKRAH